MQGDVRVNGVFFTLGNTVCPSDLSRFIPCFVVGSVEDS